MAHQDARDLAHEGQGRGYAPRVFPARPSWLRRPSPRTVDALLVLVVALLVVPAVIAQAAKSDEVLATAALALVEVLALFWRRQQPFVVLAVVTAVTVLMPVDGPISIPLLVAIYTIGSRHSGETTIAAAGAVVAVGFVYRLAGGPEFSSGDLLGLALVCAIAAGLGLYVGNRRANLDRLHERAELLDRERELLAQRAVAEERVRIAQELHDVVAHNVSLIVVQAQALGATAGDERVTAATDGIADLGREAMAEMHRTLKLLRGGEDGDPALAPQPGLGQLDDLLERARGAGVGIDLTVEGEPRPLSQSVDLSAYRIVQEALTNVVKHAGRAHTTVTLGYRRDALELTIADRGVTPPQPTAGGHGLVGMRERAALFGGTLSAGPRDGRGFEVHASLPYDGAPA
jgi:signal transduction histidine kinase